NGMSLQLASSAVENDAIGVLLLMRENKRGAARRRPLLMPYRLPRSGGIAWCYRVGAAPGSEGRRAEWLAVRQQRTPTSVQTQQAHETHEPAPARIIFCCCDCPNSILDVPDSNCSTF